MELQVSFSVPNVRGVWYQGVELFGCTLLIGKSKQWGVYLQSESKEKV